MPQEMGAHQSCSWCGLLCSTARKQSTHACCSLATSADAVAPRLRRGKSVAADASTAARSGAVALAGSTVTKPERLPAARLRISTLSSSKHSCSAARTEPRSFSESQKKLLQHIVHRCDHRG